VYRGGRFLDALSLLCVSRVGGVLGGGGEGRGIEFRKRGRHSKGKGDRGGGEKGDSKKEGEPPRFVKRETDSVDKNCSGTGLTRAVRGGDDKRNHPMGLRQKGGSRDEICRGGGNASGGVQVTQTLSMLPWTDKDYDFKTKGWGRVRC